MDPILETIVKKYRKPWPDRDFWDFLRGAKPTPIVVMDNVQSIPVVADTVTFKADAFRIVNPNEGVQPSPVKKWSLPVAECSHQQSSVFQLPRNEVQGWEAYQCGDCGLMVKRPPRLEIWYSKGPHDLAWATPKRETLSEKMQAAINAMKDTPQNAPLPTLLPPALYERARYHYRNELEWFDKHFAVERKIPKS